MKHFLDMIMTVMVGFVTRVFRGKGNVLQFVKVLVIGQAAGAQTWLSAGCSEGPRSVRGKSVSGKLLQKMISVRMHAAARGKREVTAAGMRGKKSNLKKGLSYMRQSVCRGSPLWEGF